MENEIQMEDYYNPITNESRILINKLPNIINLNFKLTVKDLELKENEYLKEKNEEE